MFYVGFAFLETASSKVSIDIQPPSSHYPNHHLALVYVHNAVLHTRVTKSNSGHSSGLIPISILINTFHVSEYNNWNHHLSCIFISPNKPISKLGHYGLVLGQRD